MSPANENVIYLADRMKHSAPVACLLAHIEFTNIMIAHFDACADQCADLPMLPEHIELSDLFRKTAVCARLVSELWIDVRQQSERLLEQYETGARK